ncbi:MAG: hypothetical protein COA79_24095 [Planctomycetota bacterium]|nr:MAG: hypothetical protein COA79_24095 [Planctomycetota bacterium]
MTDNHLDDTREAITPIKNALGLPSDLLGEIIKEFDRACVAKKLSVEMLSRFLINGKSSRIKAITTGCVTNVIIRNGPEGENLLPQLIQLGVDVVINEIITIALSERDTPEPSKSNKLKRSSTQSFANHRIASQPDSPKNQYYGSPIPKNNSSSVTLALVGVVIIALGLITFLLMSEKKNNIGGDTEVSSNSNDSINNSNISIKAVSETAKNETDLQTRKIVAVEVEKPKVKIIKKIVPEGTIIIQKSQPSFIGGSIVSYSFSKRKKNGPYVISGERNKQFTVLKFDLDHIPNSAEIKKVVLKLNISVKSKNNNSVNIYCLINEYKWDALVSNFTYASKGVRWSYEDFLGDRDISKKRIMTMQQEWISFDVTEDVKKIVESKTKNNGFILFTDSVAQLMFLGFKSNRVLFSPKLVVTFKSKTVTVSDPELNQMEEEEDDDVVKMGDTAVVEKEKAAKSLPKLKPTDDIKEIDSKLVKEVDDDENMRNIFEESDPSLQEKKSGNKTTNESEKIPNIKKVIQRFTTAKPKITNVNRLILGPEVVSINKSTQKGNIRFSINKSLSFENSTLYKNGIKLKEEGLCIIYSAIYLDGKQISEVSTKEFFKLKNKNAIIVDNKSRLCQKKGKWESSKSKKGYYGKDYMMTTQKDSKVMWKPIIKTKGVYDIYTKLPEGNLTRPEICKYRISINGVWKEMEVVDQSLLHSQWAYLGKFNLEKGSKNIVELVARHSSKITIADATIFVKVDLQLNGKLKK